jgi:hypothetical protein
MRSLLLHPTSTAQWQALIHEAQKTLSVRLEENLESYLVFLLMRFIEQPCVAHSVLGLDFLQSSQKLQNGHPPAALKDVGDKCLLFAGLFPERATRKRVDQLYFVKLGQTAYATLSGHEHTKQADLFSRLCTRFIILTDILQATRDISSTDHNLLEQIERWQSSGSPLAWQKIQQSTQALPLKNKKFPGDKSVH